MAGASSPRCELTALRAHRCEWCAAVWRGGACVCRSVQESVAGPEAGRFDPVLLLAIFPRAQGRL